MNSKLSWVAVVDLGRRISYPKGRWIVKNVEMGKVGTVDPRME
jgi:hypothetical protein